MRFVLYYIQQQPNDIYTYQTFSKYKNAKAQNTILNNRQMHFLNNKP